MNMEFNGQILLILFNIMKVLLLLSRFSHVWRCVTPETAAHQAPPSLGFSRQEHWSGLPLPSPMHESEKWKWSSSVMSDSLQPHGLQPTRLLCPWDFPGKSSGVGCHCLLRYEGKKPVTTATRKTTDIKYIKIGNKEIKHLLHRILSIKKSNIIYLYTINTNKKSKQGVQIQDTEKSIFLSLPDRSSSEKGLEWAKRILLNTNKTINYNT